MSDRTQDELLAAARVIGGIEDMPHWLTAGMVAAIERRDRPVYDLTVGELMSVAETAANHANETAAGNS